MHGQLQVLENKYNVIQLLLEHSLLLVYVPVCYIVHGRPPNVSGGTVVADQEILKVVCETTVLELSPAAPAK